MFACAIFTHVFVWPDLKISEREKTLWASRGEHSVEINISREKEFIILIIKKHIGKSLRILYKFGPSSH